MDNFPVISGAGGGGKGGGGDQHVPYEANDSLNSKQIVRLLFAINDGQIKNETPEVYLNGALSSNFDVNVEFRRGTADQTMISGFSDVEAPLESFSSTGQDLENATPYISPNLPKEVSAVRVTLLLPQLKSITEQGDRVGASVTHTISVKKVGGIASSFSTTKSGKASNPYVWDIRITPAKYGIVLADGEEWSFTVSRTTVDDANDRIYTMAKIQSVIKIYEAQNYTTQQLSYPNVALLALTLNDSSQFGSSIPDVAFRSYLSELYLPNNYNPVTRTYSGIWNGGFASYLQWTDNLSWAIFNTLCMLPSGFELPVSDVDIGSFYLFSQVCDQLVDDGAGGMEPRFRIDFHETERSNRQTFLMYLLTLGNASLGDNEFGQISIIFDRAGQSATKVVTNANVLDGYFSYSSNEIESRPSVANVTYSDQRRRGQTDTATAEGDLVNGVDLVTRYGYQPTDIVLRGCVRESQAIRKARWALWTNSIDTEIVTFKTLLAGNFYQLGELISHMDSDNVTTAFAHAVVKDYTSGTGYTDIILDRELVLEAGKVDPATGKYSIQFLASNGITLLDLQVTQTNGTYSTLRVSSSVIPFRGSPLILKGQLRPTIRKIIKRTLDETDQTWEISAVVHSEGKYDYIDSGYTVLDPSGSYKDYDSLSVEAPVNLQITENHISTATLTLTKLEVKWDWDTDNSEKIKPLFKAAYTRDNQDYLQLPETAVKGFDIENPFPGVYSVIVWAIDPFTGLQSAALSAVWAYRTTEAGSTLEPPENLKVRNTSGTVFSTRDCPIAWTYKTANDNKTDALKDYQVEIRDLATLTVQGTYIVPFNALKGGEFLFTYAENVKLFGGSGSRGFRVSVFSRDLIGDLSVAVSANFTNPVPAHTSFTSSLLFGIGAVYASISDITEGDVEGFIIEQAADVGFTAPVTVYDGPDTAPVVPVDAALGTRYYRIAAYDTFDKNNLDWTTPVSGNVNPAEVDKFAFSGLTFTPNSPSANSVAWASASVSINGAAPVTIASGNAAWTSGTLYLCFNKATHSISTTTDITVAVTKSQILATYKGGTDLKGGDGSAFINGSQILAHSIGANQLVADDAIITDTAQIANAIIDITHINSATISALSVADHIQSTNYSPTRKEGFRIDTTGLFETYGNLKIGTKNVGIDTPTLTFVPGALTLAGNATLNNSIIQKTPATTAWDVQGYSTQSYTGACSAFFSFKQVNGECVAGLSVNPSGSANNTTISYGIYAKSTGNIAVIESGTATANLTTYTVDDIFEVKYSGTMINYLKNGVSFKTTTVSAGQTLSFDSSIYTQNAVIDQIKFGQYLTVTPDYGARMEITGDVIKVYDRNNVLRVKLGNLNA